MRRGDRSDVPRPAGLGGLVAAILTPAGVEVVPRLRDRAPQATTPRFRCWPEADEIGRGCGMSETAFWRARSTHGYFYSPAVGGEHPERHLRSSPDPAGGRDAGQPALRPEARALPSRGILLGARARKRLSSPRSSRRRSRRMRCGDLRTVQDLVLDQRQSARSAWVRAERAKTPGDRSRGFAACPVRSGVAKSETASDRLALKPLEGLTRFCKDGISVQQRG